MGYLSNFIVYFLAMIGIIILALYVYKKFNISSIGFRHNNSLTVEDTLNLSPRKTLYVIRQGNERFLIAGDMDRTTLISKLKDGEDVDISGQSVCYNTRRSVKLADLSDENIARQNNIEPLAKPIMKEIKRGLKF